jgi:hypothetical protein
MWLQGLKPHLLLIVTSGLKPRPPKPSFDRVKTVRVTSGFGFKFEFRFGFKFEFRFGFKFEFRFGFKFEFRFGFNFAFGLRFSFGLNISEFEFGFGFNCGCGLSARLRVRTAFGGPGFSPATRLALKRGFSP